MGTPAFGALAGQGFRPVLARVPPGLLGEEVAAGFLELASIARGYRAADAMIKMAPVDLIETASIDPGRCLIFLVGEVAAVEASFAAGAEAGGSSVLDSLFLPRMDPQVLPALAGAEGAFGGPEAMGLLESATATGAVAMADAACKAAEVRLFEIHLAQGIGGKGHVVLLGDLHMIEAAVEAGAGAIEPDRLVASEVIPNPDPAFAGHVLGGRSGGAG